MKPFVGYNMADYWNHWLEMGEKLGDKAPEIFHVNWFRKDENNDFMWPGFGDNMRVLLWILERCEGKVGAKETAIGYVPEIKDLDVTGLGISEEKLSELLAIDKQNWIDDVEDPATGIKAYFAQFGDKLPAAIKAELEKLEANLNNM